MKQDINKHIVIKQELHKSLKNFCKDNGLILKSFVEKIIEDKLKENGISLQTHKTG